MINELLELKNHLFQARRLILEISSHPPAMDEPANTNLMVSLGNLRLMGYDLDRPLNQVCELLDDLAYREDLYVQPGPETL